MDYNSNASDQKCITCQQKLKYVPEDVEIRECLSCLVKNKKFNKKACTRINCELYLKIHQISIRHKLISLICTNTLLPFLSKFGNLSNSLIKSFVNENKDFFEEDVVFLDWIHVLEMAVKFENEDTEAMPTRGPHRKALIASGSISPEKSKTPGKHEKSKKNHEKFKELSNKAKIKAEKRRRLFKKKQIEYISWNYPEIDEQQVRDFINQITIYDNVRRDTSFFDQLFNTTFMQTSEEGFDLDNYLMTKETISPVLLDRGVPIYLNTASSSLALYESYMKLIKP